MTVIINYAEAMLPFMALVLPLHIWWRVQLYRRQSRQMNIIREALLCLFILFLGGLAGHTLLPRLSIGADGLQIDHGGFGSVNLIPFHFVREIYVQAVQKGDTAYFVLNFLGNIGIFVPIGLMLPLLWRIGGTKVIAIGAGISLFIETAQFFLPRSTDIDDLILNTAGVLLGLALYRLIATCCPAFAARCRRR